MLVVLCLTIATLWLIYKAWTIKYNYWKQRGVPFLEPKFPFGNLKDAVLQREFIGHVVDHIYKSSDGHPYVGIYNLRTPELFLRDPEIIKLFLTKDFNHFINHGARIDKKLEPLACHIFHMEGSEWKFLRTKMTPTFTTGKIKAMFPIMSACATALNQYLDAKGDGEVLDMRQVMARFMTDIIGTCAFGLDINAMDPEDCQFRKMGLSVLFSGTARSVRNAVQNIIPGLERLLRLKLFSAELTNFFTHLVSDTIKYRKNNHIDRHDFLGLLMELGNEGRVKSDQMENEERAICGLPTDADSNEINDEMNFDFTLENMTAQCLVFFAAGFAGPSTVLSFALLELALAPDLQDRLRAEIDAVIKSHGGITYQALHECPYMDKVIAESMRKYPPESDIMRECTKAYSIPGSEHRVEEGIRVHIPVWALHHDPDYYPQPERFDPERFGEEQKAARHPYVYLPFGEGPRICLGIRFGLLQIKLGLATILANYQLSVPGTAPLSISCEIGSLITTSKGGVPLSLSKRTF